MVQSTAVPHIRGEDRMFMDVERSMVGDGLSADAHVLSFLSVLLPSSNSQLDEILEPCNRV